jgi:hypothetical protein
VRERIEYRFRVPSAAVFTLYSYSKSLEYATAGSLTTQAQTKLNEELTHTASKELEIFATESIMQWVTTKLL